MLFRLIAALIFYYYSAERPLPYKPMPSKRTFLLPKYRVDPWKLLNIDTFEGMRRTTTTRSLKSLNVGNSYPASRLFSQKPIKSRSTSIQRIVETSNNTTKLNSSTQKENKLIKKN